jgi:tripeptide aminopeptidase
MNKELIELFNTLTKIYSPSGKEKNLAEFIIKFLIGLSLNPTKDSNGIIYCRIGNREKPKLFCAHMDTVEPSKNIQTEIRNGYLQSQGKTILGGDNKIPLTAILFSVQKLIRNGKRPNVELLFTVREETNSGIKDFDITNIRSRVGYVFDAGNGELPIYIQQAPSIDDFKITISGKAAHASRPHEGVNTLEYVLLLGQKLKLGQVHPETTFNIGLIAGGDATNTVPGHLVFKGDIRSTDRKKFDTHKQLVEMLLSDPSERFGVAVKTEWFPYSFGYRLTKKSAVLSNLKKIYKEMGFNLTGIETNGGSDAGFLNFNGIETYCLGDGVEKKHTVDERIHISTFNSLQKIIEVLMLSTE